MSTEVERVHGVGVSAVSWEPPHELTFSTWRTYGARFAAIERASKWWIGDWVNYGEHAYGEKYTEAVEITGYSVGDLMTMAWVASAYEASQRSEILSWTHHRVAAGLEPDERGELLALAAREEWSTRRLEAEVRSWRSEHAGDAPDASKPAMTERHSQPRQPPRAEIVVASERGERWLRACLRVLEEHGEEFGLRVESANLHASSRPSDD